MASERSAASLERSVAVGSGEEDINFYDSGGVGFLGKVRERMKGRYFEYFLCAH